MIQTAEKERALGVSVDVSAALRPPAALIPPQTPLEEGTSQKQGTPRWLTSSAKEHPTSAAVSVPSGISPSLAQLSLLASRLTVDAQSSL